MAIVKSLLWPWESAGVWVPSPLKGVIIAIVIIGSLIINLHLRVWGGEARMAGLGRLANTFLIGPTRSSILPPIRSAPQILSTTNSSQASGFSPIRGLQQIFEMAYVYKLNQVRDIFWLPEDSAQVWSVYSEEEEGGTGVNHAKMNNLDVSVAQANISRQTLRGRLLLWVALHGPIRGRIPHWLANWPQVALWHQVSNKGEEGAIGDNCYVWITLDNIG